MAQRLVITCDQCPTETTNEEPHAHMGAGVVPIGWTEIEVTSTRALAVPPPYARPPMLSEEEIAAHVATLEPEERAEAEAILRAPPQQRHAQRVTRRALLCSSCSSALAILCGDREVKLRRDPQYAIAGGPSLIGSVG
jgi:hypothetical protein